MLAPRRPDGPEPEGCASWVMSSPRIDPPATFEIVKPPDTGGRQAGNALASPFGPDGVSTALETMTNTVFAGFFRS